MPLDQLPRGVPVHLLAAPGGGPRVPLIVPTEDLDHVVAGVAEQPLDTSPSESAYRYADRLQSHVHAYHDESANSEVLRSVDDPSP